MLNILLLAVSISAVLADTAFLELQDERCVVPFGFSNEWSTFWPLVFYTNGTLYQTEELDAGSAVVISSGETVILSCGPNYLRNIVGSKTFVQAKCREGGKFVVENESTTKAAKDFACDLRAIEEVIAPVDGCPDNLTGVKFGFVNPVDSYSYVTGEACYCKVEGRTLFAHIRTGSFESSALEVHPDNVFNKRHPDTSYKVDFMKAFRLDEFNERLRLALDKTSIPEFGMRRYIGKEILSNYQLFATTKLSFNFFVMNDHVPNVQLLEEDIADLGKEVDVYVGSHGVLKLKDSDGDNVSIYLDGERFPVPEIIWYVVRNAEKAVAFAVFTNPELTDEEIDQRSFCVTKCEKISWLTRLTKEHQHLDPKNGAVLCCEFNDFKKAIPEMPALQRVTSIYI